LLEKDTYIVSIILGDEKSYWRKLKEAEERFGKAAIRPQDINPEFLSLRQLINNNVSKTEYHRNHFEILNWTPSQSIFHPLPVPTLEGYSWIETEEGLERMARNIRHELIIAVDTESHNLDSFLGFICTMQISTYENNYVIDCIKLASCIKRVLGPTFQEPNIAKLVCDTGDVRDLQRDFNIFTVGVINFQHLYYQVYNNNVKTSLKEIVKTLLKVEMDKAAQLADWRCRPLSEELIEYAVNDSKYLLQCWYTLMKTHKTRDFNFDKCRKDNIIVYEPPKISPSYILWLESLNTLPTSVRNIFKTTGQFEFFDAICKWRLESCKSIDTSLTYFLSTKELGLISRAQPLSLFSLHSLIRRSVDWDVQLQRELITLVQIQTSKVTVDTVEQKADSDWEEDIEEIQVIIPNSENAVDQNINNSVIIEQPESKSKHFSRPEYNKSNLIVIRVGKNRREHAKRQCRIRNHLIRNEERISQGLKPLAFRKRKNGKPRK